MNLKPEERIEEYILIARLSVYSQVWHAFDENGQREVVLKFVEDKQSADREGNVLADIDHPNILKLFRRFVHENTSVLVFEYVPGQRLDKVIRQGVHTEDCFKICIDTCSALEAIHAYGLFHGDLSPFNVIWSAAKNKAYLIDFGAMGGCTVLSATPEHNPANGIPLGPYTDMVGFGRVLMALLPRSTRSLHERCLYDEPEMRPSSTQALRYLQRVRDKRKRLIKASVAAVSGLLLLLAMYLVVILNRPVGKDELIAQMAAKPSLTNLRNLRIFLFDHEFASLRDLVITSVAQMNEELGKTTIIIPSLKDQSLVAVFAVKEHPMLLWEDEVIQLGDWVTIEGEYGYLVEINRGAVVLKTEFGSKEFRYEQARIIDKRYLTYRPISIFPRPTLGEFNLEKVLSTLCHLNNNQYGFNNDEGVVGLISGSFDFETYEDFLEYLSENFESVGFDGHHVSLHPSPLPISIMEVNDYWIIDNVTISELLELYQSSVGYQLIYQGTSPKEDISYPGVTFHKLIQLLDCELEMRNQTIYVKERKP